MIVSSAHAGGQEGRNNQLDIADNHSVFGRSRLALRSFKTKKEAENFKAYISTNIVKFLFLMSNEALSSLAKLTNLNTITFNTEIQNNGDIMDFINPWIQAGRTSGKIIVNNLLDQVNITLNGSRVTYPSEVQNYGAHLNWTSDGTVTFTAS